MRIMSGAMPEMPGLGALWIVRFSLPQLTAARGG